MRTPPSARPKAKTAKAADPALGGRPGRGEILERVLAAAGETDTGLALRLEAATAVIGMVNERTAPGACGPGTPGRPSDTSAARSAGGPATPTTRSVRANGHPCHTRTRAV